MEKQNYIKTPIAKAWPIAPGIIRVVYDEVITNPDDVHAHIDQLRQTFGEGLWLLSDLRQMKKTNQEVRSALSSGKIVAVGAAVIMGNGLSKIIGNLFLKFSKPKITTRIFTDEEKAIEWLKEQVVK
ncbi:STAS/SEC14 domain-containing protein [Saprospira grandis]|uniref:DUF7793 domain-containing protein n=1 Tax=Saprospira grandis (strain Lewin) TaxID=984262 RepID=H6L5W1_SAPGL|nr:STAS/SEC14 domain-containing protein [Saprospira grandis]AFC26361.1 hypothetical protein SGRA_3637 [Saprospira grandis str. Lewin]